jgi:hypothetical protein
MTTTESPGRTEAPIVFRTWCGVRQRAAGWLPMPARLPLLSSPTAAAPST